MKITSKIISVGLSATNKNPEKNTISSGSTDVEVIIPENVVLPDDAPARMKTLRADGKKWYLTIVYHPNTEKPFALFCHTNNHEKSTQTWDAVDRLLLLAKSKGIAKKYVKEVIEKITHDPNTTKVTRAISLLLRHGVSIGNIVAELDKLEEVYVGSFLFQIKKFLSNYVQEGSVVEGKKCTECGGALVFSEGCYKCIDCGNSKCG